MRRLKKIFRACFWFILITMVVVSVYYLFHNYRILKQVYQHEEQVEAVLEQKDMLQYKEIVLAIIFTETKGSGEDPMQSSESSYGKANQITEKKESIEQGVDFLKQAIKDSQNKNCDIWTGIQAYNFGLDYIDFIAQNGGVNTMELAEQYSRDTFAPLLGNTDKKQYRYLQVDSLIYNGGYLYHNGGNFFYANLVKKNLKKIEATSFLF